MITIPQRSLQIAMGNLNHLINSVKPGVGQPLARYVLVKHKGNAASLTASDGTTFVETAFDAEVSEKHPREPFLVGSAVLSAVSGAACDAVLFEPPSKGVIRIHLGEDQVAIVPSPDPLGFPSSPPMPPNPVEIDGFRSVLPVSRASNRAAADALLRTVRLDPRGFVAATDRARAHRAQVPDLKKLCDKAILVPVAWVDSLRGDSCRFAFSRKENSVLSAECGLTYIVTEVWDAHPFDFDGLMQTHDCRFEAALQDVKEAIEYVALLAGSPFVVKVDVSAKELTFTTESDGGTARATITIRKARPMSFYLMGSYLTDALCCFQLDEEIGSNMTFMLSDDRSVVSLADANGYVRATIGTRRSPEEK